MTSRRLLRLIGAVTLTAIAGCSTGLGKMDQITTLETERQCDVYTVNSPRPACVTFYDDSSESKQMAPVIGRLAEEYRNLVNFLKVDMAKAGVLGQRFKVRSAPTVVMFSGGREYKRYVGPRDASEYRGTLDYLISNPQVVALPPTMPTTEPKKEVRMNEQVNSVTMKGKPLALAGKQPKIGSPAPEFTVVANDMSAVSPLSSLKGKVVVLAAVPSLDTSVCDTETRRFNEEAAKLGNDVAILTLSMDLPFAQKRWCGTAGIEKVQTLSDYRHAAFGEAYGVLIKDLRLLARAVFVIDKAGKVRYVEVVPEVGQQPDYEAILKAVAELRNPN